MAGERRLVIEADGGSRGNPGPAGYGAVVRDAETGELLAEVAEYVGVATNNHAEYRGLLAGLRAAAGVDQSAEVEVRMDSKLVVEQMSGRWQVKHPDIKPLAREAAGLVRGFPAVRFTWIPRERNKAADRLANEAMDAGAAGRAWTPSAAARAVEPEPVAEAPNRLSGWMDAPAPPTTTLLLRHGQTRLSIEKRFSGLGDEPLTEVGRTQAAAVAQRLKGQQFAAIVASPLSRARETAEAVASVLGLDVRIEDDLRETDFGAWEGFTFAEVQQRWGAELAGWLADSEVAPPGGESFAATASRMARVRDRLIARYPRGSVLLVTHTTPIKTLVRLALHAPPEALYRMHLDLASLTEIDWYSDGPAVVRSLNQVTPLGN